MGVQRSPIVFQPSQMGIYVHWPFCAAKCPYCDFNSHVRDKPIDQGEWAGAYERVISYYGEMMPERQVVSVFFGGGTPSLMEPETVERIISSIQKTWPIVNDLEVTLEANPTSVEVEKFKGFRDAGVNRVSLGIQSLYDDDLKFLGRMHSADEGRAAVQTAADVFDRYSFDLIYARPDQTPESWVRELQEGIAMARGHLSLYQLTIERNTPFYMLFNRGAFTLPDDGGGAALYQVTQDVCEAHGLPAYEVSNHAAAGQECRHNQIYWNYADYIGIGPGAHGRFMAGGKKYAVRDHAAPEVWLERVLAQGHGAHPFEEISRGEQMEEAIMVGLRICDGIDDAVFQARFGKSVFEILPEKKLRTVVSEGWAQVDDGRIYLTTEGLLRLNSLIDFLLADR